jgi:hypothetical protein
VNTGRSLTYDKEYLGQNFEIKTVKELKISRLWYCNDIDREYRLYLTEKLGKLVYKI